MDYVDPLLDSSYLWLGSDATSIAWEEVTAEDYSPQHGVPILRNHDLSPLATVPNLLEATSYASGISEAFWQGRVPDSRGDPSLLSSKITIVAETNALQAIEPSYIASKRHTSHSNTAYHASQPAQPSADRLTRSNDAPIEDRESSYTRQNCVNVFLNVNQLR